MSQSPDRAETNDNFARHNQQFREACKRAGIPPTKRQASHYRRGEGKAYAHRVAPAAPPSNNGEAAYMQTKHTPGDWRQWDRRDIDQGILITDASGKVGICRVIGESQQPRKHSKRITKANADLIYAGPNMLNALRLAEFWVMPEDGACKEKHEAYAVIKAAIAKATGEGQ